MWIRTECAVGDRRPGRDVQGELALGQVVATSLLHDSALKIVSTTGASEMNHSCGREQELAPLLLAVVDAAASSCPDPALPSPGDRGRAGPRAGR
jgi:hypothetical protein